MVSLKVPVVGEHVVCATIATMDAGCTPVFLAERAERLSIPESMTAGELEQALKDATKENRGRNVNEIVNICLPRMRLNAALLRMLAQFRGVHSLDLSMRLLDDEVVSELRSLPELKELVLRSTRLSKESIVALARCPYLESLDFSGCELSRDRIAALVEHGRSIRRPRLAKCGIENQDLSLLAGMPQLVELNLSGVDVRDTDAAWLSSLTNLRQLELADTRLTSEGLSKLRLDQLETLDLSGARIADLDLFRFVRMKELRHLGVARTGVTANGLLQALPAMQLSRLTLDTPQQEKLRPMNVGNWEFWTSD
jgi:Leucine-rich repeat (LRR) protein